MTKNQDNSPLLEDIVECRLYPKITDDVTIKQELLVCAMKYSEFLKRLTCDYIWYHEELRVSVSREYMSYLILSTPAAVTIRVLSAVVTIRSSVIIYLL